MTLTLTPAPLSDAATCRLVAALGDAFGGDSVILVGFTLAGGIMPDCLVQHTLEGSCFDLSRLLLSPTLREAVPGLVRSINPDRLYGFELVSPLHLSASIGEVLAYGGPSPEHRISGGAAFAVAQAWVDALAANRIDEMVVLHSRAAWSAWFGCDVWDHSWLVALPATGHLSLLCVTGHATPWLPKYR